jgi:trimeric autotransporter adhesin
MKNRMLFALLALTLTLGTLATAQDKSAVAQSVPRLVKFSGKLADSSGKPATGVAGVTFALYKGQDGGAALWLETQNVNPDANGRYTVTLGAVTSGGIPADLFASGEAQWLGVRADGQSEQPRVLLVSVPYALKAVDAETLGGRPASAYALSAPQGETGSTSGDSTTQPSAHNSNMAHNSTSPPPLTVTGSGTTNYVPLWTSSTNLGNSVLFQTGSGSAAKVGLGTTSPQAALDVRSGAIGIDTLIGDAGCGSAYEGIGFVGSFSHCRNYALLGDTVGNTLINSSGSGGISFRHNNGIQMILTPLGNVGIGTNNTPDRVDVAGQNGAVTAVGDPGCGAGYAGIGLGIPSLSSCTNYALLGNGTDTFLNRPPLGALHFREGNGEQMTIVDGGRVGINKLNPQAQLDVVGAGNDGVHASSFGYAVQGVGGIGVVGIDSGGLGGAGVLGVTNNGGPTHVAGEFSNNAGGDILIGTGAGSSNVFRVDGTGQVFADGGYQTGGADFAESVAVSGDRHDYRAGNLLVVDTKADRRLALSMEPYSTLVAGIYSTKPGLLAGCGKTSDLHELCLALITE